MVPDFRDGVQTFPIEGDAEPLEALFDVVEPYRVFSDGVNRDAARTVRLRLKTLREQNLIVRGEPTQFLLAGSGSKVLFESNQLAASWDSETKL